MANILKMEKQILIQQLLKLNWSYRRIERETGIRRETISKYDPNHPKNQLHSKAAKVPIKNADHENRPNCPPTDNNNQNVKKPTRTSYAACYDQIIREKRTLGLSIQRIYQDLVVEHGFQHGYDSVKRYVRKIEIKHSKLFARIHTLPGQEAQVDFGKGAPTLKNGRYVRPWLFKMVLSFSRHSYEECVWKQDIETFIRCHQNAFEAFGGVAAVVRLDNLKSGVLKAHLFDPELNPVYAAFAKHYGFAPLPCLPGKPEHKGKIEAGIGYTKDNALKGLKFDSLQAQNAHLKNWNKRWARTRIHGTIKKQVWSVFLNQEQSTLKSIPKEFFQFFKIGTRKVHYDGHIEVANSFYSVPHQLIGETLSVQYNSSWIKVFSGVKLVAFHRTASPGRFQTNKKHLPPNKSMTTDEYKDRLLKRCTAIGSHCRLWALKVIKQRQQLGFRAIQGVLRLQQNYAADKIDWACAQALKLNSVRYHTIKLMCEDQTDDNSEQLELLQQHDIIRSPDQYQQYVDAFMTNNL